MNSKMRKGFKVVPLPSMEALEMNEFWQKAIVELEAADARKRAKKMLKTMDYSVVLPTVLRNRVKQYITYRYDEYDRKVFMEGIDEDSSVAVQLEDEEEDDVDEDVVKKKKKEEEEAFNESTCSEIERMDQEYPKFELKMKPPVVETKVKEETSDNWIGKYPCLPRKERIIWESKVFNVETSLLEKSLDEQAEILMEASAERFCEWLNTLGSESEGQMTKAYLKQLFSIERDRMLLASIQTEPKEVKSIAKSVADKWNLPEMAIELKYEKYITDRLRNVPKKLVKVAFGRTIPQKDLPWVPGLFLSDKPITTVYPQELLSGERLFKGILHLRTVKGLVDFYNKHPKVQRPKYLVEAGMFRKRERTTSKGDIPLYERLKLKY